jgi:ABC-type cobalamin/Fe3+-siderophores transport system ATPase subunit
VSPSTSIEPEPPLIEAAGAVKRFPGVPALDGVSFGLRAGEAHALVGENGAGRSTLPKVPTGVHRPDAGDRRLRGEPVAFGGPLDAQRAGMELDVIAAAVIGGTLLTGGAGTRSGTPAGVLLPGVIQNIINQIGSLTSAHRQVVSGTFPAVVVVVQRHLSRLQRAA